MAGLAAGFLQQPDILDPHRAIGGLAHVVDRQQPDSSRGEGLHLDAGTGDRFRDDLDLDGRCLGDQANTTATRVSGSEWHSGIRSAVRLAAWIAAIRATPSTSPFFPLTAADQRQRFRTHDDAPAGTGDTPVTSLPATSTMCA